MKTTSYGYVRVAVIPASSTDHIILDMGIYPLNATITLHRDDVVDLIGELQNALALANTPIEEAA